MSSKTIIEGTQLSDNMEKSEGQQKPTVEQLEAAKLKAKYPTAQRPGGSDFLRKRLQKGQRYFDSGDYNMAKQTGKHSNKPNNGEKLPLPPQMQTGDTIPTPEDIPQRKSSLMTSKLAT
ncbi:alpha-endosulfine-like [Ptychodera flava]|uniref:alpha-endosulfine-like n=1 Tax=Ptychodera flava TaxID=63121 RepID=UPI003969DE26